jgi:hypothetical protein
MLNPGMQPDPAKPSKSTKPGATAQAGPAGGRDEDGGEGKSMKRTGKGGFNPNNLGDPDEDMTANFQWNGSAVTITFPDNGDFDPNLASQSWTWNGSTQNQSAAARTGNFGSSNPAGNTLTVVQTLTNGTTKTYTATGIARGATSATLAKQP